jgi:hypothetical protein
MARINSDCLLSVASAVHPRGRVPSPVQPRLALVVRAQLDHPRLAQRRDVAPQVACESKANFEAGFSLDSFKLWVTTELNLYTAPPPPRRRSSRRRRRRSRRYHQPRPRQRRLTPGLQWTATSGNWRLPACRISLTPPGVCQIGHGCTRAYMDHTGCHQLVF